MGPIAAVMVMAMVNPRREKRIVKVKLHLSQDTHDVPSASPDAITHQDVHCLQPTNQPQLHVE